MIRTPVFPDLSALVVDESLYTRRIVRDMLARVGIRRVQEAPDGAEGLGALSEGRPDLIIMDWDLGILTGEEVIRLVRDVGTSPAPSVPMILNDPVRKVPRSIYEGARDMARDIARSEEGKTSRRERKKVEMLFAHLKRILKLDRLRLRGPNGAKDEFHLAAAAQNLRKLAKIIPVPQPSPA